MVLTKLDLPSPRGASLERALAHHHHQHRGLRAFTIDPPPTVGAVSKLVIISGENRSIRHPE